MIVRMKYLTTDRKTGNYVYRRAVPPELREAMGRREINKSLGTKDLDAAHRLHAKAHQSAEEMLLAARTQTSPASVQKLFVEFLRERGLKPEVGLKDPALHEIERDLRVDMLDDMHYRDPEGGEPELIREANRPKADVLIHGLDNIKRRPTLADALDMYMAEKGRDDGSSLRNKRWQDFHRRAVAVFAEALSHGDQTLIDEVSREDVRTWRDRMIAAYSPETVKKHYTTLNAIFGRMYDVLEIDKRNPFAKLVIQFPKKELQRDKRNPLSDADEALILDVLPKMNKEAQLVVRLMLTTGCRPVEVCHLMQDDVVLDGNIPYVHFRPNERNGWIIKGAFARKVPVVDTATLDLLRDFPDGPSRYAKPNGNASASTAINKVLRENGLSSDRVSLYSARHTMRKRLMAVEAPEYVTDEILGHSGGSAKDAYGDGLSLEVASEWLKKALAA